MKKDKNVRYLKRIASLVPDGVVFGWPWFTLFRFDHHRKQLFWLNGPEDESRKVRRVFQKIGYEIVDERVK